MANSFEGLIESRQNVNLVVYVCPLGEALPVVEAVFADSQYRSLSVRFAGYDDSGRPLVKIEVVFASWHRPL